MRDGGREWDVEVEEVRKVGWRVGSVGIGGGRERKEDIVMVGERDVGVDDGRDRDGREVVDLGVVVRV